MDRGSGSERNFDEFEDNRGMGSAPRLAADRQPDAKNEP
jgi:hypothetical protein